jgi:hypothetical protein
MSRMKKNVDIELNTDKELSELSNKELGLAMDTEVNAFNAALRAVGMEPLTSYERAILKTYIAWKLGIGLK